MERTFREAACPKCGDTTQGYRYEMTETHVMNGPWGKSAEASDHTGKVSQSLVECYACGHKFQLATLQRRGLVG